MKIIETEDLKKQEKEKTLIIDQCCFCLFGVCLFYSFFIIILYSAHISVDAYVCMSLWMRVKAFVVYGLSACLYSSIYQLYVIVHVYKHTYSW